jgi:signal recognition particle subunit SRP54
MITDLGDSITNALSKLFKTQVTDEKIEETIKGVCTSLLSSNVSPKYVMDLRTKLRESLQSKRIPSGMDKAKVVQNAVFDELVSLLDPKVKPYKAEKGRSDVIVFVGLQGCGKTTSICKYANYYKKKGFKVGIVCADTFRAGAFDQIRQNALKIKVPFFGSDDPDPVKVASEGVERFRKDGFELILVDTSGRHTQEKELFTEMKDIIFSVSPQNVVFVMDAGIGQSAEMQAKGFKNEVDVGSIILTKVDGTSKAGGALSSVAATHCPIEFIGTGEGMEDFDVFNSKRFVGKMLGMGDIAGLMEKVGDLKIDEEGMLEKLGKGVFHLKDFYDQFQQILSLGPLTKVFEMIPGMSKIKIPDEGTFRKMICIFDSFSKGELNSDGSIFEKEPMRIMRVAKGSGTSVRSVGELLLQFRQISVLMRKMGSMPGMMEMMKKGPSSISLAQKTKMKQQMKGAFPREVYQQMSSFLQQLD